MQDSKKPAKSKKQTVPPHYWGLVDVIANAAYIKDVDGVFLHCNRAFEMLVNLPREAIVGKTSFELFPRDVAQRYKDMDERLLRNRGNGHFQVPFERLDGRSTATDVLKTVIYDWEGNSAGVMGIVSDASQRRMTDEVLQRYELLLKHSRDFIWMIDPADGRILEANLSACQAYGYSRQEFRRLSVYDLRAADQKPVVDAQMVEARREGILFETLHRRRDGSVFPVQVNAAGTRLGEREVVVSLVRDISEAVKAREELKRQNEYLSMLHETALALINRLDGDDLLAQIVARAATLAGTENAFIFLVDAGGKTVTVKAGTGVCAQYIGQQFPADAGMNARIIATGQSMIINEYQQWPQRLGDSRLAFVESLLGVPLTTNRNITGILGFIGLDKAVGFSADDLRLAEGFANLASLALHNASLYRDLQTELEAGRALEEELTAKNADLAETLTRLQATQLQMVQQEKLAGIGQLAAGIAHEINNPLGFVLSNFGMMQKYLTRLVEMIDAYRALCRRVGEDGGGTLSEEAARIGDLEQKNRLDLIITDLTPIFDETNDGLNRVGEIVKALRMFSRVDQGDEFEEYDLNAGIRSTLTVARNEVKYVARVETELGEVPLIAAFGGRINQVLLNIILNAAQAIDAKQTGAEGVIRIRSYRDGDYVCCSVADNGTGIAANIIQDIFNPFFTTKPVGKGTGLGLSVSYDIIVNKHHGEITADSKAGEGAVFTIRLPIRQPE